jgi:hypothetical protein
MKNAVVAETVPSRVSVGPFFIEAPIPILHAIRATERVTVDEMARPHNIGLGGPERRIRMKQIFASFFLGRCRLGSEQA